MSGKFRNVCFFFFEIVDTKEYTDIQHSVFLLCNTDTVRTNLKYTRFRKFRELNSQIQNSRTRTQAYKRRRLETDNHMLDPPKLNNPSKLAVLVS